MTCLSLTGETIICGRASGLLAVLADPLSLWGGFDVQTGEVIDATHPQRGLVLSGCVVAMSSGRGSSSSSGALVEAVRLGTAPAGFVLENPDPVLSIGAIVAQDLYGSVVPIMTLSPSQFAQLKSGSRAHMSSHPNHALLRVFDI